MAQHRHHIEHFRDATIFDQEQVLLEHVEGELSCREKPNGRREWHGYMEVSNAQHIEAGAHLRIVLHDGRTGEINASDIRGTELPGKVSHAVEFYVCGELRGPGRARATDHGRRTPPLH